MHPKGEQPGSLSLKKLNTVSQGECTFTFFFNNTYFFYSIFCPLFQWYLTFKTQHYLSKTKLWNSVQGGKRLSFRKLFYCLCVHKWVVLDYSQVLKHKATCQNLKMNTERRLKADTSLAIAGCIYAIIQSHWNLPVLWPKQRRWYWIHVILPLDGLTLKWLQSQGMSPVSPLLWTMQLLSGLHSEQWKVLEYKLFLASSSGCKSSNCQ